VAELRQQEALQRQAVEPLAAPPAPLYLPLHTQTRQKYDKYEEQERCLSGKVYMARNALSDAAIREQTRAQNSWDGSRAHGKMRHMRSMEEGGETRP
jgi:hypothetical protein